MFLLKPRFMILSILFLGLFFTINFGQTSTNKSHEIGKLWETMVPSGSLPTYLPLASQMTYPGGDFWTLTNKNLNGLGLWIGVTDWTDSLNIFHSRYVSEGGYANDDARDYIKPISNKKKVRNRLPIVTVNGNIEERITDTRSSSVKSSSLIADERIETKYSTNIGVKVQMRSYALANQNHNSYIIKEYTLTNDGNINSDSGIELPGQNLTGVYFGFQYYMIPGGDKGHDMVRQHDDWSVYYGNQPGDSLRGLFYMYDGRAKDEYYQGDDIGDPDKTTGEFLSPQYPGFGVLHADTSPTDDSDDRSQPSTVNIQSSSDSRSKTNGHTDIDLYAELSSGEQSTGTLGQAPYPYESSVQAPIAILSFGPYNLNFGESVTIVLYEVVGSISKERSILAGREWINGTIDDEEKNAIVGTGLDSLLMNAKNAEHAWEIGLKNLPTPPPAPDNFDIVSGPGKIELSWKSVADMYDWQVYQASDKTIKEYDFAGYRVYRAEGHFTNVYKLIADIVDDTTHYTDRDVERGKKYYYSVTAYDDGIQNTTGVYPGQSLESSRYSNRNYANGVSPFLGASSSLDQIYVVPNPYHVQGLAYGGTVIDDYSNVPRIEDKLMFVGLPAIATIRVFTMSGDLVTTIPHPNPDNPNSVPESADEEWYQITDSWQNIKSGVYIYYVEGWDRDGKALGSSMGKFVIIR